MDPEFWHSRWQVGQIGFHEGRVNRMLAAHIGALDLPKTVRLFLPLCGKAFDIHWLLSEGYRVAGIEQITLDSGAGHLKDSLMPRYAELIYNGFWFSPEREMLQAAIDRSQTHVTGTVRLKLYKGSVTTIGRWSDHSLYSEAHVTFEEDAGAYDQTDAAGFIQLNALRLKLLAARDRRLKG